jgi:glycosyltransferase involved in cell wall biosynthesis
MNVLMLYAHDLFDTDLEEKSIAGTQTVFIQLSRALQEEGCNVYVHTNTSLQLNQVSRTWQHLDKVNGDLAYDLMIVNVSPHLFARYQHIRTKRKVLWIHNEAKYLFYWKRLRYLLLYRPLIIFSGNYHQSTMPFFFPVGGKKVIPFGLQNDLFQDNQPTQQVPGPRVYFTSNPLRSLRWLIDLWEVELHPKLPQAELHIFSGWQTYGAWGEQVKNRMQAEIDYARSKSGSNVIVREVLPKNELFKELKQGRAMLYRGDKAETFCLAVAEAQAFGLPAVVCNFGSMNERVIHNKTGFIAQNDNEFVNYALKVLTDDQLWLSMHHHAIEQGRQLTWSKSARAFMELVYQK